MNWILIGVIVILAVYGLIGWNKGVLRIVISLAALILTIVATVFLAPIAGNIIKENTPVYDRLSDTVYNAVIKDDTVNHAADETMGNEMALADAATESASKLDEYINQLVRQMNMPESMSDEVLEVSTADGVSIQNGMNTVKDVVVQAFAARLTAIIYSVLVHIIVFLIVYIIIRLLASALDIIGKLPVIKELNHAGGCIFGLAEGLLIVWLIFTIATICSTTDWAAAVIDGINQSKVLTFINEHNLIMNIIFNNIK